MVIDLLHQCLQDLPCHGFSIGDDNRHKEWREEDVVHGYTVLELL